MRYWSAITLFILAHVHVVNSQVVDPVSGRFQLSIPLGSIQALDVSVPVGIYHHGNALRVSEGGGACGLGWNLSVGGAVTRMLRGLPDDYNVSGDSRKGWLFNSNATAVNNFTSGSDDNLSICTDEQNDWNFLVGRGYVNDTEPDIFYVSAPGLSAQFVFGTDGLPKLLTHQDISITVLKDANQVITGFTVKNNTGMLYTFDLVEPVKRKAIRWKPLINPAYFLTEFNQYDTELTYTATWLLTAVQSTATGTLATFSYNQGEEATSNRYVTRIKQSASNSADTIYFVQERVTPRYIHQVSLKNYRIEFVWTNGLIKHVKFGATNQSDAREYNFDYVSMYSVSDNHEVKHTKSFLREIKQIVNCKAYPSYRFNYSAVNLSGETVDVPWKSNFKQDWYGFYNGVSDNKNIPTVYFYSSQSDGKRLRVTQNGTPTNTYTGNNRAPVQSFTAFGALEKIDWPSGGYTAIEYELNKYKETGVSGELNGGGLRVKKLITSGGEAAVGKEPTEHGAYRQVTKEYEYVLSDNSSSGKILYPPAYAFATGDSVIRSVTLLGEPPEVLYTRVVEKIPGQGRRVLEFEIPGTYPSTEDGIWKATKSKIARSASLGCPPAGNLKNGYYTLPFAPSSNFDFARGQLAKVEEYSETGTLVRERTITYTVLTKNPSTLKGLAFEKIGNTYHFGQYEMLTGRVKLVSTETVKEMGEENPSVHIQSTTAYAYNSDAFLETITTTNTDGSVKQEKIRYAKNFNLTVPTDTASIALKALNDNFRHGEIVERIQRYTPPGGTQKVVGAELVTYRDYGGGRILPYYLYAFPQGIGTITEATIVGQNLHPDGNYFLVKTLKEYDGNGYLINEQDNKRNKVGHHYALDYSLPVATFYNAKAQHAIYEGFEMHTGRGLNPIGAAEAGWTGEKAYLLTTSNPLLSSSTNLIVKGESKYRVSCWVKAAQSTTITFNAKNGSTTQASLNLSNPVNNTWVYLEGEMNMASVSNAFQLEVKVSSHTAIIDDIVFMPTSARVALSTFKPVTGVTSATDDRGNSITYTYDEYGRLQHTFDRHRNLIQRNEYIFQAEVPPTLNANFSSNTTIFQAGQQVTFTAGENCLEVTYAWEVVQDGAGQIGTGSNSTLQFTFPAVGQYNVKLTVSSNYGEASYTQTICVDKRQIPPFIRVTHAAQTDPYINYSCNSDDTNKTFSILSYPSGDGITVKFRWSILSQGDWYALTNDLDLPSIEHAMGGGDYTIRCIVTETYANFTCPDSGGLTIETDLYATITYVNNEPCQ
ncbi:MAG: PKD domain-containing protein [Cyclobacteriaceae bacterium]|nr:PKD domain-containing protein [Cyclobacteriaceae bacterium]